MRKAHKTRLSRTSRHEKTGRPGLNTLAAMTIAILAAMLTVFAAPGMANAEGPKIISLYAADTEILLRLGARDDLVGISRQETYDGPETIGWERPPTFSIHDDVEKFLAAAPDVILLRPQHLATKPALFETLERFGVKLWTRQVTKASELYDFWRDLGAMAGREAEAEAMIAGFQKAVGERSGAAPEKRPGVFLESIHREVKTFTPESIPVWLMTLAGGRNAAQDAEPARPGLVVANYGPEKLLEKAGEIEVFISQEGQMNSISTESILNRDIYQPIAAFKNGRVYRIPEELISRPTPSLLEGLGIMTAQIQGTAKTAAETLVGD